MMLETGDRRRNQYSDHGKLFHDFTPYYRDREGTANQSQYYAVLVCISAVQGAGQQDGIIPTILPHYPEMRQISTSTPSQKCNLNVLT
jgi:hypothetical protein